MADDEPISARSLILRAISAPSSGSPIRPTVTETSLLDSFCLRIATLTFVPSAFFPLAEPSTLVELDVTNPKQLLAPGMFAEVQWPVGRAASSLFVPRTAVVRTSERQFVVRVRNGVAEWVDVKRGEASGEVVEVFGDLREGDVVVRRGNDEIRPGTKITPAATKS